MLRPSLVERVLFIRSTLPPGWIILLGAGFLLFAIWQSVIIARGEIINSKVMAFAALMAVLPAIILGGSLLFSRLPWHPRSRTVLWIGEVYMLSLGAWYAGVYQALRAPTPER